MMNRYKISCLPLLRIAGKQIMPLMLFMAAYSATHAQPDIQWENNFGGSQLDEAYSIEQTDDGGFVVAGRSGSSDGDISVNNGKEDFWIVKLNETGQLEWEQSLGGSNFERAFSIEQTEDGGFVVAGKCLSCDGVVSDRNGSWDYWVVKLDATGQLEWEDNFGGSGDDEAYFIEQTKDKGYIVAGWSESRGGDVSGNNAGRDYWIIKLDETGQLEWENNLGGYRDEVAYCIEQTEDRGYVVAGWSYSSNGDVSSNNGDNDYWIVKLDETGQLEWENNLGGTDNEIAYSIEQTEDGGYVVAGRSFSSDGNVSDNNGSGDYWIVKLDETGQLDWESNFGGSGGDGAYSIEQTKNGGYVAAGYSRSSDKDVSANNGEDDYWIVKLDETGQLQWEKSLGGPKMDEAQSIEQTKDRGFVVAGWSGSGDGDVSANNGSNDYWIVKLRERDVNLGPDTILCDEKDSVVLSVDVFQGDSLVWNTGDTTEQIVVREPGTYYAKLITNDSELSDTIEVSQVPRPQIDIGPDQQVFCSQVDTTLFPETQNAATYRWNTGDTSKNLKVNEEGRYWLRVESKESCSNADTIQIEQLINLPEKLDSNKLTLCGPQATLDANNPGATYQWNTGSTDQTITVNLDGLYWVEISNDTCSIRDTVEVDLSPRPQVYIGPSQQAFCGQIDATLVPETKNAQTYRWNTGDTTKTLYVDEEGQYWLRVESEKSCSNADTTEIREIAHPESLETSQLTVCWDEVELDAGNPGANHIWNTGDTTQKITVDEDGQYIVSIANAYCSIRDTVEVKINEESACPYLFVPNAFSPNGDGLNDVFKPEAQKIVDYEMTIYNRWGQRIFQSEAVDQGWDGTVEGAKAPLDSYLYQITYKIREDGIVQWKTKEGVVQLVR